MKNHSSQKSALITGAAQRIGAEMALCLAQEGYDIALHYFHSKTAAQKLAESIQNLGRRCKLYSADLGKEKNAKNLIPRVTQDFPHLDILVNNASIFRPDALLNAPSQAFDENFALHLKTPFILTQSFAQACKRGHVIHLLDSKIAQNQSAHFSYLLSKKALFEFMKIAALQLAPSIRVNAIAPGVILPPAGKGKAYLENLVQKVPLKKSGSLKDITRALIFLVQNDYITGQCLFIDGGSHLL